MKGHKAGGKPPFVLLLDLFSVAVESTGGGVQHQISKGVVMKYSTEIPLH